MKPRIALLLPLFACAVAAAHAAANIVLPEQLLPDLDRLLQSAVQQSPRMLSRAIDVETAENNSIQHRAGLLPSLSAYASYYKSDDRQEYLYPNQAGVISSYRVTKTPFSVTLSQPLFHWGERRNTARIGEISANLARRQYREAYRLLAQEVRTNYVRLIAHKISRMRARYHAEISRSQLQESEARWQKKAISDADIAAVRLDTERAEIAALQTELDFENAKMLLARLTGTKILADAEIPDGMPAVTHQPDAFRPQLARFLEQRDPPSPEAVVLRSQLEIENLNYANAKTRLRPKLSAVAAFSQDQQNNLYGTIDSYSLTSLYAGVSVNWSIFDGFASGAVVRNTLARRRNLENEYRVLTERLAQDMQSHVRQLEILSRQMKISDRIAQDSRGALQTAREEFQRGVRTEAYVNQMQLNLYDADVRALHARLDYLLRSGEFLGLLNEDPILANLPSQR